MKLEDFKYAISLLLLIALAATGLTGYIQSQLELRRFIPHRFFACVALSLAALHVILVADNLWRYIKRKFKRTR